METDISNMGSGGGPAFPVGSVFLAVVSTNPGTLLGYGTWAAFAAGRMLVGFNSGDADFDTAEETGGAKTHTLITGELPVHNHGITDPNHTHTVNDPGHQHGMAEGTTDGAGVFMDRSNAAAATTAVTDSAVTGVTLNASATNITINNAGSGQAHNNMPPYITVYMWKRTA